MKCDELQRHSIRGVMFNGEEICGGFAYYDADEVDEAIAELKAQLESEKASHYAESVDAGMRERRLKRALYKACANWMIDRQLVMKCFHLETRARKFNKAIDKCLAMAEKSTIKLNFSQNGAIVGSKLPSSSRRQSDV